jgi:RimJ/RimL family protein N-acetyltransferase
MQGEEPLILELQKESFTKIKHLIGDFSHYLVLTTLFEGFTPGKVWVNQLEQLTTALVWDRLNTLFFLMGDSSDNKLNRELNDPIMTTIFPEIIQMQYHKFYLQFTPHHMWEEQIDVILKRSISDRQFIYSYMFNPNRTNFALNWEPGFPDGYKMTRITYELLNNLNLQNLDYVVSGIRACWQSTNLYLRSGGIGYCLLKDDVITSWCSTDCVINAGCELYVETLEGYGRKGLGTLVALACVQECIAKGLIVYWHCFNNNIGSIKIAEKINLAKIAECPVYIVNVQGKQEE